MTEFIIQNKGTSDLQINSLLFVGGQAGDFYHDLQVPLTIYAVSEDSFTVMFTPTATGLIKSTVH